MDPALQELIRAGRPSDEVAVLLRLADNVMPDGVRIVARFGSIATARVTRKAIPSIHDTEGVHSVKAPRLYAPDWMGAPEESDRVEVRSSDERRPSSVTQTGRGVVVALIDWGLDLAHPDFRSSDGRSRVLALWDQRSRVDGRSNNVYGYGWIHDQAAITAALRQRDPYSVLAYHPADAGPGPTHGTHTAGIAVGNGRSGAPAGMAPGSEIVFVHLATAKGERGDNLGDSVALLEAIDFIARIAGPRPWVLSLSMGRHAGPHDGCTLTEQGMDAALGAAPGRACIQSTGNYYSRPIHTQGILRPGEIRDIGFHTGEEDGFAHEIDIWYSGRDRIAVEIVAPDKQSAGKADTGGQGQLNVAGRPVGRLYNRRRDPNNRDNQAHVYLDASAPRGAWTLRLCGTDVVDGRYHCWVERDPGCSTCQPSFDPGDVVSSSTTGTICNGFLTIAVGAYDGHRADRPLSSFSSSGPTRDGRLKPDLIAPGVQVLSARSTSRHPTPDDPLWARMSGTSMAAPYVAGTVALMFEAAGRPLQVRQTRELLLGTAEPFTGGESQSRWGSGYVSVTEAVAAAAATAEKTRARTGTVIAVGEMLPDRVPRSPVPMTFNTTETTAPVRSALSHEVCRLAEEITFDYGKSFVFPRFRSVIEEAFAGVFDRTGGDLTVASSKRSILVAGHAGRNEISAGLLRLSQRRARAVVAILTLDASEWESIALEERWWWGNTEIEIMAAEVSGQAGEISRLRRYQRQAAVRRRLIRHYLQCLRPAWLGVEGQTIRPKLAVVMGEPPGVIACDQRHARHMGFKVIDHNRRAEIYFLSMGFGTVPDLSGYLSWQSLCTPCITPQLELRDESTAPYVGPFDLILPTGEILHEFTDTAGRWSRPGLPAGRYTVSVPGCCLDQFAS